MNKIGSQSSEPRNEVNPSRRVGTIVAGCALVVLLALLLRRERDHPDSAAASTASGQGPTGESAVPNLGRSRPRRFATIPATAPSAEEIVARKLTQFGKSRRELVHALAQHFKVSVPGEVERFFDAVEAGRWEEIDAAHKALLAGEDLNTPRSAELHKIWRAIQETWGIAREAHDWPAQKLLEMDKNPDAAIAIEQSFPFKSMYANATSLGPIMELRVQDGQNALTPERAAQSIDYWRTTAQQLAADPDLPSDSNPRRAYAKLAAEQAGLLLDRNYAAEAEQALRFATQIGPASPEAVFGYVNLLVGKNRFEDAIPVIENAVKASPGNQNFRDLLERVKTMKKN